MIEYITRISTIVPLVFYFLPAPFVGKYYIRFIYQTLGSIEHKHNPDRERQITKLKSRIKRIISFVSFLAIYVSVLASFLFSNFLWNEMLYKHFDLYVFVIFSISGGYLIWKNLKSENKFIVSDGHKLYESFLVVLSVYLLNVLA